MMSLISHNYHQQLEVYFFNFLLFFARPGRGRCLPRESATGINLYATDLTTPGSGTLVAISLLNSTGIRSGKTGKLSGPEGWSLFAQ